MLTTPAEWESIKSSEGRLLYKLSVSGDSSPYTEDDIESNSLKLSKSVFEGNCLIGNTPCFSMECCVKEHSTPIPKGATLDLSVALTDGSRTTTYVPVGSYKIHNRTKHPDGWVQLSCRDRMQMANQPCLPPGETVGEWPRSMRSVLEETTARIGLTLDPRSNIQSGESWVVQVPSEYTIRAVWSFIAAAHGSNAVITPNNTLLFYPPKVSTKSIHTIENNCTNPQLLGDPVVIGQVSLVVDEEHYVSSGTPTGFNVEATCPYADQTIVDYAKSQLSGTLYTPIQASEIYFDPCWEIQDPVSLYGVNTLSGNLTISMGLEPIADLTAPSIGETEDEYGFSDTPTEQLDRKLRNATANLLIKSNSIEATVKSNKEDIDSKVQANSESIESMGDSLESLQNDDSISNLEDRVTSIETEVSAKVTDEEVSIKISKAMENGATKVVSETGVVFNQEGMTVDKSGAATATNVNENGMIVSSKSGDQKTPVLVADSSGVQAVNLTAQQYLTIGRSRFENYQTDRTGVFWTGGE